MAYLGKDAQQRAKQRHRDEPAPERFGLHAHGQDEKEQRAQRHFRMRRGERKQDAAHRAGGTDQFGGRRREGGLQQAAGHARERIKDKIARPAEQELDLRSDEPKGQHIDQQMEQVGVEKEMGEDRPPATRL